jgi:lactoylglutathione lyase
MTVQAPQSGLVVFVEQYSQCVEFYRDLFRLTVLMEKPNITSFLWGQLYFQIEDSVTLGIPPTRNLILRQNVSDVRARQQALSQQGIALQVEEYDWGVVGYIFDPHGNKVEYFQKK